MITAIGNVEVGTAEVRATQNRGFTAEELTEMCLTKMLYVADGAPPVIKEQALAFRDDIRGVLLYYIRQAQRSQNTSIYNVLMQAGQHDTAEVLRKL